jgi:hypothetical protein
VWSTDSNGNYTASITGAVSGNSTALESLETTFHQDLNGDGAVGVPPSPAQSGSVMMVETGNDNFVFRPDLGAASTVITVEKFEPHAPPAGDTNTAWLISEAHDQWHIVQSAFDGDHHHTAAASLHIADLYANHFIIN